jgi:hypothetical protein
VISYADYVKYGTEKDAKANGKLKSGKKIQLEKQTFFRRT